MNIAPKNIKLSLLVILTTLSTYAQQDPPPPPQPDIVPPGLPIDGSVALLFLAAILYGVYSLRKFNLQSK
ncbi:PID-CTERM protein-sorting domain-containing protein [Flavobacterium sp.]|uniref:PID-CTERM protein-sorting domain-containing protein n=1 Tax=Flavobacterium sp. TaxID=239 RepID=UPI00261D93E4|nr:hypothetical protein [Flavobacterium sp.]